MTTDAGNARATLGICALAGTMLSVLGSLVLATTGSDGGYAAGSVLALAGVGVGAVLLLVAATGWAVSLGVRAAGLGQERDHAG